MSDERPERPEGDGPRDPDTPAPDDLPEAHLVEESDEIDLGETPVDDEGPLEEPAADEPSVADAPADEAAPRRVSRITAAVQGAAAPTPSEAAPSDDEAPQEPDVASPDDHDADVEDAQADPEPFASPDEGDQDVDDAAASTEGSDETVAELPGPGVETWEDTDDDPRDDATVVAPAVTDASDTGSSDTESTDAVSSHRGETEPDDPHDDATSGDRDAWPFATGAAAATAASAGDDGTSGDDPQGPADERRRRRRWPLLLGAAVVLGAVYVAGWFLTGTRLPGDVTVAGVQVGGMSTAEARQTLEEELTPREDDPVRLVLGEESFEVVPDDAGLALDVEGSVDQAGGRRSWDPRDMIALVVGSSEHPAALDVDDAALDSAVAAIAEAVDVPVTEALITFPDAKPKPREPKDGRVVRKADTAQLIQDEYLVQESPAEVPVADEKPVVDSEGLARAVTEIGEPAVAAPVTIEVGDDDVELPVTAYAPALTVEPVDGAMAPVIDAEPLAEPLTDATTGIGEKAVDATVDIEDGKPVVVPGKEGVGLQPEEMAELLPPVLTKSGDERTVQIEAKVVQPAFTTEDAEKLGITEKISEFTTEYPHAEYRNVNQSRGAALIDGTILEPGETFSFNDTVGERTEANGFTTGSVINGGRFVDELGGGVSQVVTTTYNAAFFAGLDDVEHHPHAFYIDRYPEGREATVYFGSLDLRFRNNLKNGVLIKAFVQKSAPGGVGRTTVQMWGTKEFDVEAGKSERRNTRAPKTRYDDADDCVPQAPLVGFDVDIYRTLSQGGKVVKRETDTAVYQAADRIVCGEEPDDD